MFILYKFLLKAFLIGFFSACAMGPIFLLVLNRALDRGFSAGFLTAIGTSCADIVMFLLGSFGVLSLTEHYPLMLRILELVGGVVLILIGLFGVWTLLLDFSLPIDLLNQSAKNNGRVVKKESNFLLVSSGFLLNISNPMSILFFTSILSKVCPELARHVVSKPLVLYAGILCGIGSLAMLSIVSVSAALIAKIIFKKIRVFLKFFAAAVLIFLGIYLVGGVVVQGFGQH